MVFGGFCGPGSWGYPGYFGFGSWIGLAINLIFGFGLLIGLVLLTLWAVRHARVPDVARQSSANAILQARYARGELTREQYQLMKEDIA